MLYFCNNLASLLTYYIITSLIQITYKFKFTIPVFVEEATVANQADV
jgi:hypothetical protein